MPVLIPLSRIQDSPFQTRRHYDQAGIESLADDIERRGLDQVPKARLVYPGGPLPEVKDGAWHSTKAAHPLDSQRHLDLMMTQTAFRVQLAFGHRRLRALRLIAERRTGPGGADLVSAATGLPGGVPYGVMPVELEPMTDEQMFAKAVGENAQREGLSAVEEAEAMHRAIETFGWTHETVGERWGLSRSAVSNKLRLLKLPEKVRAMNVRGEISEGRARALVGLYDCVEQHGALVSELIGPRSDVILYTPTRVLERATEAATTEEARQIVAEFVGTVEAEAARLEAERKRREEPGLFEDEEAGEGVTQSDADACVAAELDRINSDHNAAILWIKDPSFVRAADTEVLEKTYEALLVLTGEIQRLIERSTQADVINHGRDIDRVAGGIRYDIDRVSREIGRRKPAEPTATAGADDFDDGGEALNRIAEAKGLPPVEAVGEEGEPTQEQRDAWAAEWDALDTAVFYLARTIPEPARPIVKVLFPFVPGPFAGSDDEWASELAQVVAAQLGDDWGEADAREAAEAWGIEVAWPVADAERSDSAEVSAKTSAVTTEGVPA